MIRSFAAPAALLGSSLLIAGSLLAAAALPQPWGALQPPEPVAAVCPGGARVSSAKVESAYLDLKQAIAWRNEAMRGGSPYASAKLGLPPGSPEWADAVAAQASLKVAEAALAQACAAD